MVRAAILYAIAHKTSVSWFIKGYHEIYEGQFKQWGYDLPNGFGDKVFTWLNYDKIKARDGEYCCGKRTERGCFSRQDHNKDVIADAFPAANPYTPAEYSVIATLKLNGDYIFRCPGGHCRRALALHQGQISII